MSVQSYVKLYNALLLILEAYLLKTSIQYLLLIICLCLFYIFFTYVTKSSHCFSLNVIIRKL